MKETVLLSSIVADASCQARVKIRKTAVKEYAEAYATGNSLPPLKVFRDEKGLLWLGDGFHRRLALLSLALPEVRVEVEISEGGRRAAFLCALGANTDHGLARTNADKRRAVELALADEELRRMSDRKIAAQCAVSHNLVNEIRRGLSSDDSCMSFDDIREGQDGKVRRLPKRGARKAVEAASGTAAEPLKLVLGEKIAGSPLGGVEGEEFNVIEASRGLDAELRRLMAEWPAEKRHSFCVHLHNLAVEADPEVKAMTKTAFDEVLEREGGQDE